MLVSYSTDGTNFQPLPGDFTELVHAWPDVLRVPGLKLGSVVVLGERVAFDVLGCFPGCDALIGHINRTAAAALDDPRPLVDASRVDRFSLDMIIEAFWKGVLANLTLTRDAFSIVRTERYRVGSELCPEPVEIADRSDFHPGRRAGQWVPVVPDIDDATDDQTTHAAGECQS